MSPEQLIIMIDTMAIGLARGKSADELNVMGCMLNQLGDALSTMGAQKNVIEKRKAKALECAKAKYKVKPPEGGGVGIETRR
jgi:hypothetical protein